MNQDEEKFFIEDVEAQTNTKGSKLSILKKAKDLFVENWQAILCVAIIAALIALDPYDPKGPSVIYASLEVGFIITLGLALLFKKLKKDSLAWCAFALNRVIGFMQPAVTILYTALVLKKPFNAFVGTYVVLLFDVLVTFWSLYISSKYFEPAITTRFATADDVEDLLDIEESAFEESQRASRETILRRIKTSPKTNLIAIHREHGAVGSLYSRLCISEEIRTKNRSWDELNNDGDFTPPECFDAAYTIGLQTKKGIRDVSKYLQLRALQRLMEMGCRSGFGGPRIPGYGKSELTLEEYIKSGNDKVLAKLVSNGGFLGITRCWVVKPLENYWEDPESKNCAALVQATWSTVFNKVRFLPALLYYFGSRL